MHVRVAMRTAVVSLLSVVLTLLAVACGVQGKKEVAHAAVQTVSAEERRETIEATLRILDEHPELVDEFYALTRKHPKTFNRFMANTTRDLKEEELATLNAELLARHPESLEQVFVRSTDEIVKSKEARKAMRRAMARRAQAQVDILTDDPDTLSQILNASIVMLEKKPAARKAMLLAVRKNRERIVDFMKDDPALAKDFAEQLLHGVIDDVTDGKEEKAKERP